MKLLTLKRKIIVWYYKDKEPYRSRRSLRAWRKSFVSSFKIANKVMINYLELVIKSSALLRDAAEKLRY